MKRNQIGVCPNGTNTPRGNKFKFFQKQVKVKVKVTKSKILVSTERSCHREQICVILNPQLSLLVQKLWSRLSFFSKVGQKSGSRSQGKKICFQQKGLAIRNTHVIENDDKVLKDQQTVDKVMAMQCFASLVPQK